MGGVRVWATTTNSKIIKGIDDLFAVPFVPRIYLTQIYIRSSLKKVFCVYQAINWCGAFLHQQPSPLYDEPLQWLQLPVDADNYPFPLCVPSGLVSMFQ